MTNSPSNLTPVTLNLKAPHTDATWLEAEIAATTGDTQRALLFYEAGHLSELAGNTTDAARLYLQAVNTDTNFAEPVERLLALFEQRHSMKNVGRVVERLHQLASTPAQRERSAIERAAFALIEQQDRLTACQVLKELVDSTQVSATAWNLLQCIAEQSSDQELLVQALKARTLGCEDPMWSGILLLELAQTQASLGDVEGALESLDQLIEAAGPRTFAAFEVIQQLAASQNHYEALARSYLGQASLLDRAIRNPAEGDTLGVPRWRRSQLFVAEAFLRAALARQASGSTSEAATLLEKARDLAPADPLIQHVTLLCAEQLGDLELALGQARTAAGRASGRAAAVAWLRVALLEFGRDNLTGALQATENGLAATPDSVALRGLELHTLARTAQPAKFAAALEACADRVNNDLAKSRYLLAAADVWARNCSDAASAKAALAQAGILGTPPSVANRMARLLAIELRDAAWYDESTRRLASSASDPEEQLEHWLELLRIRLVRNQPEKAHKIITSIGSMEPGEWLSAVLDAVWRIPGDEPCSAPSTSPAPTPASSLRALKRCAQLCPNDSYRIAFELADARRELQLENPDAALASVRELATREPNNLLSALVLTRLQTRQPDTAATIDTLCAAADAVEHDALAGMFAINAQLLAVQADDPLRYAHSSESVRARAPALAATLDSWLSRTALRESGSRGSTASTPPSDRVDLRTALESFAREVHRQNLAVAGVALDQVSPDDSSLGIAVALAKLLFDSSVTPDAIDRIASLLPSFEPISAALRVRYALNNCGIPSAEHLAAARHWSEVDTDAAATLEYLVAARAEGKLDAERNAWGLLETRSVDRARTAIQLANARFRLLGDTVVPALISAHSTQAKLVNLEASRPGCDPRRRRQSLQDVGPLYNAADQRVSSILMAFNSLAAGSIDQAVAQFKQIVADDPGSVSAWEGLRLAAEVSGDLPTVALACESLGKCMGDAVAAAECYEQAATLYFGELNDEARGERLLTLAVTNDISRFSAFDRLFRRVRDRNDGPRLLELIDLRLNVSDDVDELVKLHWERARVLRGMGERDAALQALENVTLLEPDHVGALALAAEIAISSHQLPEACKYLDQLARLDAAPDKQRLMSAMAAADIYETKLGQADRAVSLLLMLIDAGLATLAVRERLARCAAQAENWQLASEVSLGLAEDRETSAGRVEAARLAMSICREKMAAPAAALPAVECILAELPADLEVIDFLLEQPFPAEQEQPLFLRVKNALCEHLRQDPFDAESIDRLAQLTAVLDDRPLRQVALGALVTLEAGTQEMLEELAALDARVARAPAVALDAGCYAAMTAPGDSGPISELFRQLAPLYNETLGPSLTVLGVTKKHRLDPRAGLPLRNEIAAWAGALGLGEFDVYVGGVTPDDVVGVPAETPALVIGTALSSPLSPEHRQLVARELYAIRQGTSLLRHRSPAEVAALVVATCRLAEVTVMAPPYAMAEEFLRLLNASIPRKTRKLLPSLCAPLANFDLESSDWFAAAIASRDRMATVAAGDVSLVLGPDAAPGTVDDTVTLEERRRRVLPFIFSPEYLSLRSRLGVAVR